MFCFCKKKKSILSDKSGCKSKSKSKTGTIDSNKILHDQLNALIELNLNYNIEFNKITNEINKIKLSKERKDVFELDNVRNYTPIKVYIPLDEKIKLHTSIRGRGESAPPKLFVNTVRTIRPVRTVSV